MAASTKAAKLAASYRKRRYLAGGALLIPAIGTHRRLQALVAIGWSWQELNRQAGKGPDWIHWLLRSERVHVDTAAMVRDLYDRLSMQTPPMETYAQRNAASRARNRALREGWSPPLAWDDDEIDDPLAEPEGRQIA